MAETVFEDFTVEVNQAMDSLINSVLEECASELESQVKNNSRVATGKTKNSFRHRVDEDKHVATVGSSEDNAVWEEFGTGEYALGGNGRKGGWVYKDSEGEWHRTYGKRPSRAFHKAYIGTKDKIINRIQNSLKGL